MALTAQPGRGAGPRHFAGGDPMDEEEEEVPSLPRARLTVGDVTGPGGLIVCPGSASLADAAVLLTSTERTAALAIEGLGSTLGLLTENDLLQAFVGGAARDCNVAGWLRSARARLPQCMLPALTVGASTTMKEAARQMYLQTGSSNSRHHLVVEACGSVHGVLSALDIVKVLWLAGLCSSADGSEGEGTVPEVRGFEDLEPPAALLAELVGDITVEAAMKPREALPECPWEAPLTQAFAAMAAAGQNCVVAVGEEEEDGGQGRPHRPVHGVITPRDLLHVLAGDVPVSTAVGSWLLGSQRGHEPREVAPGAGLVEAAANMATGRVHHLVVKEPSSRRVAGILSALDVVCAIGRV
uniref:CBS domain-containing protein n=1 Tax=Alexandrium catenella TaxID=2925 RepID=A0A7S1MLR6_ALECA